LVKWSGHIKPGQWSNEIIHHMDWLPTFLAMAGNPNIKEELKKGGVKAIIYFTDDGDYAAVRYGDWKATFLEQKHDTGFRAWMEPFTELRVPLITNLRRDPYECAMLTSNTYYDWMLDRVFMLYGAKAIVGKFLATFKEFPPRQKAASFNLGDVMEKMSATNVPFVIYKSGTHKLPTDTKYLGIGILFVISLKLKMAKPYLPALHLPRRKWIMIVGASGRLGHTIRKDGWLAKDKAAISNSEAIKNADGSYTIRFNSPGKKNNL